VDEGKVKDRQGGGRLLSKKGIGKDEAPARPKLDQRNGSGFASRKQMGVKGSEGF